MTKTTTPRVAKPAAAKGAKLASAIVAKAAAIDASAPDEGVDTRKGSVVKSKYKATYRARANSLKGRNCADWLAQTLVALTLDPKTRQIDLAMLSAIVRANGVDPTYANRSPGWQGRMRMTLGLKLRPVVAKAGHLVVPGAGKGGKDGKATAPAEFVAAYRK